jgi:diketogulonate reductase-like aldo/keto reductase
VWPTSLGFTATLHALEDSLQKLGVSEIDLYLLHWPYCYSHFEWMDCTQVIDPHGTWQSSLRALKKA